MINLLPPDVKQNITYARRNTQLLRWSIILLLSIVSVFGFVGAGTLYMNSSIKTIGAQVASGQEQLKLAKTEDTQKRVEEISGSLKLVVQVLSRQVQFSKLLQQIGSAMPPGSILTNLSITKIQGGIDLSAAARDYQTATQVQVNLQDPKNKVFDKVDIISITCESTTYRNYPCLVTVRAQFTKDNPFLFIKPQSTTSTTGVKQ